MAIELPDPGQAHVNSTRDLGIDINDVLAWFANEESTTFDCVRVTPEDADAWKRILAPAFRRCYITDDQLADRSRVAGVSTEDVLAAKLPDPGSTMAGDFGELLVFFYQASKAYPVPTVGPKKWRLKQDRTKPAPHSDVVHLTLPSWPLKSDNDAILCSEVKTKATRSDFDPISKAIQDSTKDRTSRLARTLSWLRERAISDGEVGVSIRQLERFINATDDPPIKKSFRAVAVVCDTLLESELAKIPEHITPGADLVIISIPNLHQFYNSLFGEISAITEVVS
jgi:hypothetical protein